MDVPISLEVDLDLLHLIAVADGDVLPPDRLRGVLRRELGRFIDAMTDHFRHEERVAGHRAHAATLARDHRVFRQQLEELLESTGAAPPAQSQKRLLELLDALAEHERTETS